MGNLEDRQEEQCAINNTPGGGSDARQEANPSPSMGTHQSHPQYYRCYLMLCLTRCWFGSTGKQKQGKANSRKSKSPNLGQAYAGGERPSSVSSVHSEGDYHRQAQAQPQWNWDDRPSSTGEPPGLRCNICLSLSQSEISLDYLTSSTSPSSRFHAIPLQPTDHAHTKQHATNLHSFPLHTEPAAAAAAAAAATLSWSPSDHSARVAVSPVRAIWDPVWQRWLSPASCSSSIHKRRLYWGLSVHPALPELALLTASVTRRWGGVIFILVLWRPLAVAYEYKQQPVTGRAVRNKTCFWSGSTHPACRGGKQNSAEDDMSYSKDEELDM